MKIVKLILQALLIAQFGFFGTSKVIAAPEMVEAFTAFGYPSWFMVLTGIIELAAVLCLAYGFINPRAVYIGAALIVGLTVGAIFSHTIMEGNFSNAVPPLIVLAQTLLMTWLHRQVSSASMGGAVSQYASS